MKHDKDGFLEKSESEEVRSAKAICKHIKRMVEDPDLPEAAEEFAASILEKSLSIHEWIETKGMATRPQIASLENMEAGLEKWFR